MNGALDKLKALYEFMTQHDLETLELSEGDWQVRLARRRTAPAAPPASAVAREAPAAPALAAPSASALPPGAVTIKSTMMGIFYRAPSPSSPPFVKEGEAIKPGQVLFMIEAMKVFNEIKAEFPCIVYKALVENGKPVKSGQDLFIVTR